MRKSRVTPIVIALILAITNASILQSADTLPEVQRYASITVSSALDGDTSLADIAVQPRATIRVGELGITADGMFYVADAKGYFTEQGLDVQFVRFDSGAAMMAPLATGQLEVAGSAGINVALFNALARDLPIVLIADNTSDGKQDIIMPRTDLREQTRRPADLRGRRVAINAQGSILQYILGRALERDGLSLNDVDLQFVPFPEMRIALENRAVDVIVQVEPFATLIEQAGVGYKWLNGFDIEPEPLLQVAATMYNRNWATNNPIQARGFAVALLRGIREMISAAHNGPNRAEVIDVLIDRTVVKDRRLYDFMEWPGLHRDGELSVASIESQQRWYLAQGLLNQTVDINRFIDLSFIRTAAVQLGPYSGPGGY